MKNNPLYSEKKYVLACLLLFFLLRLIIAYFSGWEVPLGDGKGYSRYALAILNQPDWLSNPSFSGDSRAPGYPFFLAAIYFVFGHGNLFAVYFFQALLSALTAYYIFKLSRSVFKDKSSWVSFFWAGFYCYYCFYVGTILRETLIFFLIIYSFFHLFRLLDKTVRGPLLKEPGLWKFVASFSFLLHTDARYFFYIPFFLILFWVYRGFRAGSVQYLVLAGIIFLSLIPWSVRNYMAYGGIVLINTRTLDLRKSLKDSKSRVAHLPFSKKSDDDCGCLFNPDYPSKEERNLVKQGLNPKNRSEGEIDAILNDRLATRNEIERRWYSFKNLWRPYHFVNEYKPWPDCRFDDKYSISGFGLVKALNYGILLPFMIMAGISLVARKHKHACFLIFPIVIQTVLHVLMWGIGRYRNPIDAFVIILACYGMVMSLDWVRGRRLPHERQGVEGPKAEGKERENRK
jgi:hypothetical protein